MTFKSQFTPTKIKDRLGVLALVAADLASLFIIFGAAVLLRKSVLPFFFPGLPEFQFEPQRYWWLFAVWLLLIIYEEGYSRRFALWDEVKFIWKSAFFASVTILTMLFLMKRGQDYSRLLVGAMFTLAVIFYPFMRLRIKRGLYAIGLMRRKALIVGSGEAAVNAWNAITGEPNLGYEIAGFLDDAPGARALCGLRVHQGLEKIERYIKQAAIHDVIVAKPELEKDALVSLINHIQHKAENTLYIPDISGIAVSGTELRTFFREQAIIIEIRNNLANPLKYGAKRLLDYLAGLAMAAALLPVMAFIALLVKLDSKGPAILRQKRLGKNAREFYCYKFRTMFPDAEERLQKILDSDTSAKEEWEKYWKLSDDPRITRVGGILRKTSLDELPQILNVIRGEMSLIGPRPYLPREWEHIKEESAILHALPPGITGLWQVSGRNNQDYKFRITMDGWYVKNWSLWLDVMIFFKTFAVVLKREGAR